MTTSNHWNSRERLLLALGFFLFSMGILIAYRSPATEYELSQYAATPIGYWVGIGASLFIAVIVSIDSTDYRSRGIGYFLATINVISIIGIPIIRNYYYYGGGDSLSHYGWARELMSGILHPLDLLYPGVHLWGIFISEVLGYSLTRSLMLIPMVIYPLVFVMFVALCVQFISGSTKAMGIGIFSALLFLPINKISVHTTAHPSSQAILFLPFVLFLLLLYLYDSRNRLTVFLPIGILFTFVTISLLFIHPQETLTLLALLGGITTIQFFGRRYRRRSTIASHRSLYFPTFIGIGTFLAWTMRHERATDRIQFIVQDFLYGPPTPAGEQTAARTASIVALGGSIEELFIKLFLISLIFCILAGSLGLLSIVGFKREDPNRRAIITYLTIGLIPVGFMFVMILVTDQQDHYFRFLGFLMVPLGILGAVALSDIVDWFDRKTTRRAIVVLLVLTFVVFLTMQAFTFHHDPYIYQPNKQVTEGSMHGHVIAFDHMDDDTVLMAFRQGPRRYVDAVYGRETARSGLDFPGYRSGIEGEVFSSNMTTHYDEDRYLRVINGNYRAEVELYRGLRYTEEGYTTLESEPTISKLHDNGDFQLYRLNNGSEVPAA